jgi:putative endonuclease
MTDASRRKRAERTGRLAEDYAALILRLQGYRILARRAKTSVGELDIVARKGNLIVIMEVKQRPDELSGRHAVPEASWYRIARAAEAWLAVRDPRLYHLDRRFDLFLVFGGIRFRHLKDTWRPDFALTRG